MDIKTINKMSSFFEKESIELHEYFVKKQIPFFYRKLICLNYVDEFKDCIKSLNEKHGCKFTKKGKK